MIQINEKKESSVISIALEGMGSCTVVGDRLLTNYIQRLLKNEQSLLEHQKLEKVRSDNSCYLVPPFFLFPIFPRNTRHRKHYNIDKNFKGFSVSSRMVDKEVPIPSGIAPRRVLLHFMTLASRTNRRTLRYRSLCTLMGELNLSKAGARVKLLSSVLGELSGLHLTVSENNKVLFDGKVFDSTCVNSKVLVFSEEFCKTFLWNQPDVGLLRLEKNLVLNNTGAFTSDCALLLRYLQTSFHGRLQLETGFLCSFFQEPGCSSRGTRNDLKRRIMLGAAKHLPSHIDESPLERDGNDFFLHCEADGITNARLEILYPDADAEPFIKSRPELELRKIVEQYTGKLFPSVRPSWLTNPETGCLLELDLYNKELGIAFEYQGFQHYEPVEAWGGVPRLLKLKERDEVKRRICKEMGVVLHEVDGREFCTNNLEEMRSHVEKVLDTCLR
jgi:hypothetical protein